MSDIGEARLIEVCNLYENDCGALHVGRAAFISTSDTLTAMASISHHNNCNRTTNSSHVPYGTIISVIHLVFSYLGHQVQSHKISFNV